MNLPPDLSYTDSSYDASSYKYKVGGSLSAHDPTYVERQADINLYNSLKAGECCHVLNSRQMGKSSLRVRTMERLQSEGFACASVDLSAIGSQVTVEQWYEGIIYRITRCLNIDGKDRWQNWLDRHHFLSPAQRLGAFIEEVLLEFIPQNIIVFIDEIDSILDLKFPVDDFFALIRACYNFRAENSKYNRLTFCLIGVSTPSDLIQQEQFTPFNIGCHIELTGFTLNEATPLIRGLEDRVDEPQKVLEKVLNWTGGQPFLTQKLCRLIVKQSTNRQPDVDRLVREHIVQNWQSQDIPEHFKTIENYLLRKEERSSRLLKLYQEILTQNKIALDNSHEQMQLRLSGIAIQEDGNLKIYNRLYEAIFDLNWVKKQLDYLRPYRLEINQWLENNRDPSYLLRGRALEKALEWKKGKSLSVEEEDFLTIGQQEHQKTVEQEKARAEIALEQERKEQEIDRKIKRILLTIFIITVFILFGVLAGVFYRTYRTIEQNKKQTIDNITVSLEGQKTQARLKEDLLPAIRDLAEARSNNENFDRENLENSLLKLEEILGDIWERNRLEGHEAEIRNVSFSPNGTWLATASGDKTARLWNLENSQIITLDHLSDVFSVSFSPDEQEPQLATGSRDGTVRLWNVQGKLQKEFPGREKAIYDLEFKPDGQALAIASEDRRVYLLTLDDNENHEVNLLEHSSEVYSLNFSPDGQLLVTGSRNGIVRLWNSQGGLQKKFRGSDRAIYSVSFSPDGQLIATGSRDGTVHLWDLQGRERNTIGNLIEEDNDVNSVRFSPDGKYLATALSDGTIELWDLKGNLLKSLQGHEGAVFDLDFKRDCSLLASASNDTTIRLWDLSKLKPYRSTIEDFQDDIKSLSLSSSQKFLATASSEGKIYFWDSEGHLKGTFQDGNDRSEIKAIIFDREDTKIATASQDGTVRLWDLKGNLMFKAQTGNVPIYSLSFQPDGNLIAVGSENGKVYLKDWKNRELAREIQADNGRIYSVSFTPDGQQIITGSSDGTFGWWDLQGNLQHDLELEEEPIHSFNFNPNKPQVAIASENTIRLMDLSTNTEIDKLDSLQLEDTPILFYRVQYSPDGKRVAIGANNGKAYLWNLQISAIKTLPVSLESNALVDVWFDMDGKQLFTVSDDGIVKTWDVESPVQKKVQKLLKEACLWLGDYIKIYGDPPDLFLDTCESDGV
ncbi:MAG: AAA-like domain-containing protein [Cyanobacteria bacterium SID2]|nr:AAA-like domain-containing protein [Cyanobacteria bacterium SID2]MBP0003171.1 AAA-like domain-containing protein [Cyanobacteria bacterium SBC]